MIARRVLKLRQQGSELEVPVSLFAPEKSGTDWQCRFEIGWPEGVYQDWAAGLDAMQAIVLALQKIGATLYASEYHKAGLLMWDRPGNGYGFPLPQNARDLLEGDDARYF
jgi:hypothetical protein